MRKIAHIARSGLVLILALQVLNLSIASQAYWDYDYSYAYNSKYDPTETAVEWIVEMNCGQQPAFSYDNRTDTNKNTFKSFHWQIDLDQVGLPDNDAREIKTCHFAKPAARILSPSQDTFSPPPESMNG